MNCKPVKMTKGLGVAFLVLVIGMLTISVALADDIEIFSGGAISVKPNVLIILDTSGSMDDTVPASTYDPLHDYSLEPGVTHVYTSDTIYYYDDGGWGPSSWEVFSTSGVACPDAQNSLDTYGHWQGYIRSSSPHNCGSSNYERLKTGNYLNYEQTEFGVDRRKIDIATEAVENLVGEVDDNAVRFGLMRFNGCFGGTILVGCGDNNDASIISRLHSDSLFSNPTGGTPLGECLAEAGLYFAGARSWVYYPSTYTSPIEWRCQMNHIIVVTDGNSQCDAGDNRSGWRLFTDAYLFGLSIAEYGDGDSNDPGYANYENDGTDYLDDVAYFLNHQDLIQSGTDPSGLSFDEEGEYHDQNIIVHTVGFATETNLDLLVDAAAHTGGTYVYAQNSRELEEALMGIVAGINEMNANFVAPVVPVSKMNRVYAGNSLYLGLFRPEDGGVWKGNLKKYGINSYGQLLQRTSTAETEVLATDANGHILEDARSCWNNVADGSEVDLGGTGLSLLLQSGSRYFYTYQTGNTALLLSAGNHSNEFSKDNAAVTAALLGVGSTTERDDLIDFVRAEGIYNPVGSSSRDWVMGDILHSRPAVLFDGDDSIIFVGSNDGFLHCFVDDDGGTVDTLSDDAVSEEWCFVPWDLIPRLHELNILYKDEAHDYFVDGSPVLYTSGTNKYVTFGLRRGGSKYYTLDVGNVDADGNYQSGSYSQNQVSFAWEIGASTQTALGETLGQSWCTPRFCEIKTGSLAHEEALIISGGYDDTTEDNIDPASPPEPLPSDTKGRAIYAIDASDGSLLTNLVFTNSNYSAMTHSIVDLICFDYPGTGSVRYVNTLYAGDLGGNLFAFNDRDADGSWSESGAYGKLLQARAGDTANMLLKFFYAPDVVLEHFGDYVYIGSGDRANSNEITTVNRFYAVKNTWPSSMSAVTESDAHFIDLTDYDAYDTYSTVYLRSDTCKGWYIKFNGTDRTGEKVVSSPLVFEGIVYFTTYVPDQDSGSSDECATSSLGTGYLYAIDYLTGEAIETYNFNKNNDEGETVVLDETDRYTEISDGIPTQPTLIVTDAGPQVLIGAPEGVITLPVPVTQTVNRYYWKQD